MKFTLLICTYQRPGALLSLLESVRRQDPYPDEIIVVDGSLGTETKHMLQENEVKHLVYLKVKARDRGLTRQRNLGLSKVSEDSEVVCFLDDDIILLPHYFKVLLDTYRQFPDALGVAGYITNGESWRKVPIDRPMKQGEFCMDGWVRQEGRRFVLRRKIGLAPNRLPSIMPDFSHGYSSGYLPPTGRIYQAELLMGGTASYRKSIFSKLHFSSYFEGYGLYEDADFSLRASKLGKLYVNTGARLEHHHAKEGRPGAFSYGQMVIRNGWYVWRIKCPSPSLQMRLKWNATSFLLSLVRLANVMKANNRREIVLEFLGRVSGWGSLLFNKPRFNAGEL